ncbi:RNA-binding protein, partial [Nanoarchaeota archaeon]
MNPDLKNHLIEVLMKDIRFDGRKKTDFRDIQVEIGCISTAEGSARVKFGDTEVIAGVKLAVGTPFPDTPDAGVMMVNAEMLPLSNPDFETGPPSIASIETSRVIDRGLRECGFIDTKKLCITPGEKVWLVQIDIVPINYDGNLLD